MLGIMDLPIKYRGRQATSENVALVSQMIAANPDDSRRPLSVKLCRAWNWVQPNGALCDMVCRGFMLELDRAGYIGCRDRFIGWSADSRWHYIHLIAYNTRFLILPWVWVPHLAFHILAKMTKRRSFTGKTPCFTKPCMERTSAIYSWAWFIPVTCARSTHMNISKHYSKILLSYSAIPINGCPGIMKTDDRFIHC